MTDDDRMKFRSGSPACHGSHSQEEAKSAWKWKIYYGDGGYDPQSDKKYIKASSFAGFRDKISFCLKLIIFWKIGADGSHGSNQSGRLALSQGWSHICLQNRKCQLVYVLTCKSCRGQVFPSFSQGWTCSHGGTGGAWHRLKTSPINLSTAIQQTPFVVQVIKNLVHLASPPSDGDFS